MIGKDSQQKQFHQVELCVVRDFQSGYVSELRMADGERVSCRIGKIPPELKKAVSDPTSYGLKLFDWVFQQELRPAFEYVQNMTREASEIPTDLQFRLWLDPSSEELSVLHWETLCESPNVLPLSVGTAFSRLMRERSPLRWPIWERPIRILLIVSSPENLDAMNLEVVDHSIEKSIYHEATQRLGNFLELERLHKPTIARIREKERNNFHITHLLAHAVTRGEDHYIILPDENNMAQEVPCEEVALALAPTDNPSAPHLVFLATPLRASERKGESLIRLASLLIRAGVQSVVTIQAPMEAEQLRQFTESFYETLILTGAVDVAMADAREKVYQPGDWQWTYPILFTRTADTHIYLSLPESLEGDLNRLTVVKG